MLPIDTGDTAWMLVATALVMLMTPGLAFFYAGFTRNKNALSTIMQSFIVIGLVAVLWAVVGYSLAFGSSQGGLIGNFAFLGLKDVGMDPHPVYMPTIPHQLFMAFQLMFAIITPALITGAFAERVKFSTFLVFIVLWSLLVYSPVVHWVWADGGWLGELGALDFAGGTAIHINSGAAALVAAIIFGKRLGYGREPMEPHNATYIVLGAALLWFGWFGFNAGSAGAADGLAVNAFTVTHLAAGAAALSWLFASWAMTGKASVIGVAAGAVAGLVAITPAAGFVQPMEALLIGGAAGGLCYMAVRMRARIGLDDSLDVVGVHGVGGTWGAFATGLFAVAAIGGVDGLFHGNGDQVWRQLVGIGAVWGYSFAVTGVILKVLDMTLGIRVSEDEERLGLDVTQHGERAYVFEETGVPAYAVDAAPEPAPMTQPAREPRPTPESA